MELCSQEGHSSDLSSQALTSTEEPLPGSDELDKAGDEAANHSRVWFEDLGRWQRLAWKRRVRVEKSVWLPALQEPRGVSRLIAG